MNRMLGHVTQTHALSRLGEFVVVNTVATGLQPLGRNSNGWDQGERKQNTISGSLLLDRLLSCSAPAYSLPSSSFFCSAPLPLSLDMVTPFLCSLAHVVAPPT